MSRLKDENVNECVSLLREFIAGAPVEEKEKGTAVLALYHLQKITAGSSLGLVLTSDPRCNTNPRGDLP